MRERGLKSRFFNTFWTGDSVAPVRERGLKFPYMYMFSSNHRRSREGAWIEILRSCCSLGGFGESLP